jgi:hypothetical protein
MGGIMFCDICHKSFHSHDGCFEMIEDKIYCETCVSEMEEE